MRTEKTIGDLRQVYDTLNRAAANLKDAIGEMESVNMPTILVHSENIMNRRIPEMFAWSTRIAAEAEAQAEAFFSNSPSQAQLDKERADRQRKRLEKAAGKRPRIHRA